MDLQAVLFGVNDVLVYTARQHCQAWRRVMEGLGVTFNSTTGDSLRGKNPMQCLDSILESYEGKPLTPAQRHALCEQQMRVCRDLLEGLTVDDVGDEVYCMLEALRDKGYQLGVATSDKNARLILERTGLSDLFDTVVDGNDAICPKPHPQAFLLASHRLGVRGQNCLAVCANADGLRAAVTAGARPVLLGDAAPQYPGWQVARLKSITSLAAHIQNLQIMQGHQNDYQGEPAAFAQ